MDRIVRRACKQQPGKTLRPEEVPVTLTGGGFNMKKVFYFSNLCFGFSTQGIVKKAGQIFEFNESDEI